MPPKKPAPKLDRTGKRILASKNLTKQETHLAKVRPIVINLAIKHTVNGKDIGPGKVRVTPGMALCLLETEQRIAKAEREMYQPKARIIRPMRDGRMQSVSVAPEMFDELFNNPGMGNMMQFRG